MEHLSIQQQHHPITSDVESSTQYDDFEAMLYQTWSEAVQAAKDYRLEEALRRFQHLRWCCREQGYNHPLADMLCANVGILHWHLGELEDAKHYLIKAIRQAPDAAIYRFIYGCITFELGEYEDAHDAFDTTLALFPPENDNIDYKAVNLDFVLRQDEVVGNICEALNRIDDNNGGLEIVNRVGIHRLPGMVIFQS